jgi:hypothetical protein
MWCCSCSRDHFGPAAVATAIPAESASRPRYQYGSGCAAGGGVDGRRSVSTAAGCGSWHRQPLGGAGSGPPWRSPGDAVEGKRALAGAAGGSAGGGPRGQQVDSTHAEDPDDLQVQVGGERGRVVDAGGLGQSR